MKRSHWLIGSALTLALAAPASGCVVRARPAPVVVSAGVTVDGSSDYATVYPTTFAPEPIPEYRPAPPGYGYNWVDGYWDWTGYDWTWSSGYWVPERVGYAYIAPRYVYVDGRPVYYRGYWQGDNGYREYGYGGYRGAPPAAWRGRRRPRRRSGGRSPLTRSGAAPRPRRAPPPAGGWRGGAATPPPATGFRGTPTTSTAPPPAGGWRGGAAPGPAATPGAATPPPAGMGGAARLRAGSIDGSAARDAWERQPGLARRRRGPRARAGGSRSRWSVAGRLACGHGSWRTSCDDAAAGGSQPGMAPGGWRGPTTGGNPPPGHGGTPPGQGGMPPGQSAGGMAPGRMPSSGPPPGHQTGGAPPAMGGGNAYRPAGPRPWRSRPVDGRRPRLRRRQLDGRLVARPQHGRAGRRPPRADAGAHGPGALARQQEVTRGSDLISPAGGSQSRLSIARAARRSRPFRF